MHILGVLYCFLSSLPDCSVCIGFGWLTKVLKEHCVVPVYTWGRGLPSIGNISIITSLRTEPSQIKIGVNPPPHLGWVIRVTITTAKAIGLFKGVRFPCTEKRTIDVRISHQRKMGLHKGGEGEKEPRRNITYF